MPSFLDDIVLALRSLRRAPGFVALATLSLGPGLGLSTAVYALLDAVTHPTSPYREVDRLLRVRFMFHGAREQPTLQGLRDAVGKLRGVEGAAAFEADAPLMQFGVTSENAHGLSVGADYFALLGLRPRLGRLLTDHEPQLAMVVSDEYWRERFGNRAEIGNAQAEIDGVTTQIVGVLPPHTMEGGDIWRNRSHQGTDAALGVVLRFDGTMTASSVGSELAVLVKVLSERARLAGERPVSIEVQSLRFDALEVKDYHRVMLGAALCVLLIACANVSALMLRRGLAREKEYALRIALGARRALIARGVVAEGIVLAAAGCLAGVLVASWATTLLNGALPEEMHWLGIEAPRWSARVFGWSTLALLGSAAIASGYPAWRASHVDPAGPLKDGGGGQSGRMAMGFRWLVAGELTVTMMLLVSASLMIKSAWLMAHANLGYDPRSVYSVGFYSGRASSSLNVNAPSAGRAMVIDMRARLSSVPGVVAVGRREGCYRLPQVATTDRTTEGGARAYLRDCAMVGPGYFAALGIRLLAGRDILDGDEESGAVVIDERGARLLFPHESALGHQLQLGKNTWFRIVGIAPTLPTGGDPSLEVPLDSAVAVYVSLPPKALSFEGASLVVRASGPSAALPVALGRTVRSGLPATGLFKIQPLAAPFLKAVRVTRYLALTFALLGLTALVLATAGVFSVVSYSTSLRMREFAVRIALGASGRVVGGLVLRETLVMSLGGMAAGAVLGMWAGFLLWYRMWEVYPVDVTALVGAEVAVLTATLMASSASVRSAMRVKPAEHLRAS